MKKQKDLNVGGNDPCPCGSGKNCKIRHKTRYLQNFVLSRGVTVNEHYKEEKSASSQAEEDLDAAFLHKEKLGSDFAVAEYLKAKGYVSVSDFNIVGGR